MERRLASLRSNEEKRATYSRRGDNVVILHYEQPTRGKLERSPLQILHPNADRPLFAIEFVHEQKMNEATVPDREEDEGEEEGKRGVARAGGSVVVEEGGLVGGIESDDIQESDIGKDGRAFCDETDAILCPGWTFGKSLEEEEERYRY